MILTNEDSSNVILDDGFRMLVRGNFTEAKLRELLDTTSEIRTIDISECSREEFDMGFSDAPIITVPAGQETETAQSTDSAKTEPQPGDYVIQKEAGKAKQITKPKKKKEHKQSAL